MKEIKFDIGLDGKILCSSKLIALCVNSGALQLNIKELAKNIFSDIIKLEKEEERGETSKLFVTEFIEENLSFTTELFEEEKWSSGKTVNSSTGSLDEKESCFSIYVNDGYQTEQDDDLPGEKDAAGKSCILRKTFNGWPLVFISNLGFSLNNLTVAASNTTIPILLFIVCLLIQPSRCWYCGISRASVEVVDFCPLTQDEWNRRSVAKNCTSFSQQYNCSSPETYLYHCVITSLKNGTVEVCAKKAFINFGYCAEYDFKGQLIQENFDVKCQQCPQRYLSLDAYKYQECYNLTQENKQTMKTDTQSKSFITTAANAMTVSTASFPSLKRRNTLGSSIAIPIGLLLPVLIISFILFAYMYKKKICKSRPKRGNLRSCCLNSQEKKNQAESQRNHDVQIEDVLEGKSFLSEQEDPEDCKMFPSGQSHSLACIEVSQYWSEHIKGIMLTSGQRYTSGLPNRTGYLDEDEVAPDISVRDKERFNAEDQESQSIKDQAMLTLNNTMLTLGYDADKDDCLLPSLLESDEFKVLIEEVEYSIETDFTSEKAPLLRNYADRIQDIVKRHHAMTGKNKGKMRPLLPPYICL